MHYLAELTMKALILRHNTRLVVKYQNDSVESKNKTLAVALKVKEELDSDTGERGHIPKAPQFKKYFNELFKSPLDADVFVPKEDRHYFAFNGVNVSTLLRCGKPIQDSWDDEKWLENDMDKLLSTFIEHKTLHQPKLGW